MNSEAKQMCSKYGVLWKFIEKPELKFHYENYNTLKDVIYDINKVKNVFKYLVTENYISIDSNPSRYDINRA